MLKPLSPIAHRASLRFVDEPPATEQNPAGGAAPPPAADQPKDKTFTQDDLTRVATREKAEGRNAALNEVAEQLGVTVGEAKAIVKAAKDAEEAKKSDAEKALGLANKEKSDAEAEKTAAKQEVHTARLERAFLKEGVDLDELGEDKTKRLLGLVTVELGASYEDVAKDVKQIRKDFPGLFGEPAKGGRRGAPSGDPSGNPPRPTGGEDKYAAGAERAKRSTAAPEAAGNGLLAKLPGLRARIVTTVPAQRP